MDDQGTNVDARKHRLIELLNKVLALRPIYYEQFNSKHRIADIEALEALEKEYPELGLANCVETGKYDGISTFSLLATITDVLVGDRLAFEVDIDTWEIRKARWSSNSFQNEEGEGHERLS